MNHKFKQKVYETKNEITTITFLPYGNLYRIKYVKTDKDTNKTHVIESSDQSFISVDTALSKFYELCGKTALENE